ncbi:MAG: molecular chaperone DnaJ, partial [Sphingomonadaceae bacterium]
GGGGRRRNVRRGSDMRTDLTVTLEESFFGKKVELGVDTAVRCATCSGSGAKPGPSARRCGYCEGRGKVRASQGFFVVERVCPNCHGIGEVIADPCDACRGEGRIESRKTLEVRIPPGVDEGTRIRLSGEGEAGIRGGPPGDLYIFCHIAPHPIFKREGSTLFALCPVSFSTAALGGTIEVPGFDGNAHAFRIPAGIQSGKQLRKRGAGMPVLGGRGRGDMVIEIEVETPTRLSARQKQLLEEFRQTETGKECPKAAGFMGRVKSF